MNSTKIVNGPYLLDPSKSNITVAWEMESGVQVELVLSADGTDEVFTPVEDKEPPCLENQDGYSIYTVRLSNLAPAHIYQYSIVSCGVELAKACFHTQEEMPKSFKLVTLSDSHLFYTSEMFKTMMGQEKPDFIIHGGDISFGTGYQHEQYVANWFQRIPDILASTPAFYVPGNHDDGPFHEEFFIKPQAKTVNTEDGGHTYSFDFADVHFTMVDSNPWGLFEMNAVGSGVEPDTQIRSKIEAELAWIEKDLQTDAARNASWRVMVLHHPYTDAFNNRYIPAIAEKYGVDLVIGGHLHYYIKSVSVNPEVGTRTMYVCQGSTQDPQAEYTGNNDEKRLLSDFPEVTAMGFNNYGMLELENGQLTYKLYGFKKDGTTELVDQVRMTKEKSQVRFSEVELRRLDNDGRVEIRAVAENVGNSLAQVVLKVKDNKHQKLINLFGEESSNHVTVLEAGEKKRVTAIYKALTQGPHEIDVENTKLSIVVFEPVSLSYANMSLKLSQEGAGDMLVAGIEATNNLEREIYTSVPLYINQRIGESRNVFFRPHEKKYIEFNYQFQQGGDYQVTIGDMLPKEITVAQGIRVIPRVMDKSGNGHVALLQGNPRVISEDDFSYVCLDDYNDYIEIPPAEDLVMPNGFSGMVWANVDRLAKPDEMSHNPLMVRGRSVGWGATYMMRGVVERAGGLKWGTCHGITEYAWQGGEVKLKQWTDYAMTFDKPNGGNSYIDGEKVAHVDGIDESCQIRQWEHEPIFVGYSYIGHIIPELTKPKYFTHLPAKVGQVRFYKEGVTPETVKAVADAPLQAGPEAEKLAVWLDFRNILSVGSHVTEWRHPAVFKQSFLAEKKLWSFTQLKIKAQVPLRTSIKTIVEVSDDKVSVKGSMELQVMDGTNYIDISQLPQAQYIRLRSEFTADVSSDGTFIPVLQEYGVSASNVANVTSFYWSTRSQWEQGTFTGAIGFAPVDRLRDYPEYTDVIHG